MRQTRHERAAETKASRLPIGHERDTGKGYILVKVRQRPKEPGTKDNWMPKQRLVWEREVGPIPEGHVIVFCDRDYTNCDISNLICVPRRLLGPANNLGTYHDRESAEAIFALAALKVGLNDAGAPLNRCGVCGGAFRASCPSKRTCDACLAKGRRSPHRTHPAACETCGRPFEAKPHQRFCSKECRSASRRRKR